MWVSHETIYRTLFVQARGSWKRSLSGLFARSDVSVGIRFHYLSMPSLPLDRKVMTTVEWPLADDH